jgi:lysophospholipase L1-like esterase
MERPVDEDGSGAVVIVSRLLRTCRASATIDGENEPSTGKRDDHNPRLKASCEEHGIPIADICCLLRDEHFGDELHPNDRGARIIAEAVFRLLPKE